MFITTPAFMILLLLGLLALWLYVELGGYPGKVARRRGHPQAEAINVLGFLGILAAGVGWLVALVWAYTTPLPALYAGAPETTRGVAGGLDTPTEED